MPPSLPRQWRQPRLQIPAASSFSLFSVISADNVAGGPMSGPQFAQFGPDPPALLDRQRAARMKYATRRRVDWARHLAGDRPERPALLDRRVGHRHRGKQRLGIRVQRIVEQLVAFGE